MSNLAKLYRSFVLYKDLQLDDWIEIIANNDRTMYLEFNTGYRINYIAPNCHNCAVCTTSHYYICVEKGLGEEASSLCDYTLIMYNNRKPVVSYKQRRDNNLKRKRL